MKYQQMFIVLWYLTSGYGLKVSLDTFRTGNYSLSFTIFILSIILTHGGMKQQNII